MSDSNLLEAWVWVHTHGERARHREENNFLAFPIRLSVDLARCIHDE